MPLLKTDKEIELMKVGGSILRDVLKEAVAYSAPGRTTQEVDQMMEKKIVRAGAEPGFKKIKGYRWGSCISINEQIVHTPPSKRIIKAGDVVTIDAGVFYRGLHTDSSYSFQVGKKDPDIEVFLQTGKNVLEKAIKTAKAGNHIGHISEVIFEGIKRKGYSVVLQLTGHGVGKELHEAPQIPCFNEKPVSKTPLIMNGMTLAIEIMYTMGRGDMEYESDGWSIKTADNSISASFEHTVAIKQNKTLILT